mgnify:CR=1 FL=1
MNLTIQPRDKTENKVVSLSRMREFRGSPDSNTSLDSQGSAVSWATADSDSESPTVVTATASVGVGARSRGTTSPSLSGPSSSPPPHTVLEAWLTSAGCGRQRYRLTTDGVLAQIVANEEWRLHRTRSEVRRGVSAARTALEIADLVDTASTAVRFHADSAAERERWMRAFEAARWGVVDECGVCRVVTSAAAAAKVEVDGAAVDAAESSAEVGARRRVRFSSFPSTTPPPTRRGTTLTAFPAHDAADSDSDTGTTGIRARLRRRRHRGKGGESAAGTCCSCAAMPAASESGGGAAEDNGVGCVVG